jgi:hypothetical protein
MRRGAGLRLAAARAAAARGGHVLPLWPFGKVPVEEGWAQAATRADAQLAAWWRERPWANVGIACGPSGIVVIDLDLLSEPVEWHGRRIAHGREALALLAAEAGEPDPLGTYVVATPHDGEHRYFKLPDGIVVRNSAGDRGLGLGPGIDVRGSGGYIVAEGSGLWLPGRRLGLYRRVRAGPVAVLPPWLATRLAVPREPPEPERRLVVPASRSVGPTSGGYGRAALEHVVREVRALRPGERASALFALARSLGQLVGGGELDEATVMNALLAAVEPQIGVERFTTAEALRHIENGIASGRRRPRNALGWL